MSSQTLDLKPVELFPSSNEGGNHWCKIAEVILCVGVRLFLLFLLIFNI